MESTMSFAERLGRRFYYGWVIVATLALTGFPGFSGFWSKDWSVFARVAGLGYCGAVRGPMDR